MLLCASFAETESVWDLSLTCCGGVVPSNKCYSFKGRKKKICVKFLFNVPFKVVGSFFLMF